MRRYLIRANRGNAHTRISQLDAFKIEPRLPIDRLESSQDNSVLIFAGWCHKWALQLLSGMWQLWRDGIGQFVLLGSMLLILFLMLIVVDVGPELVGLVAATIVVGVFSIYVYMRQT